VLAVVVVVAVLVVVVVPVSPQASERAASAVPATMVVNLFLFITSPLILTSSCGQF
jgi:hypothetical protein